MLTQALELALALALVLGCRRRWCVRNVTSVKTVVVPTRPINRHRDKELHDRHYRCCHCLEGREREQVIVSMRDIDQLSS